MNEFETHLTPREKLILNSHIGTTWDYYGGSALLHEGRFAVGSLYIVTSAGSFTIGTDLVDSPLESGPEDFAALSIQEGMGDSRAAMSRGLMYFHERGQSIDRISVVRAQVDAFIAGALAFRVSIDHGIIFHLSGRDVYVARGGWFEETLEVIRPEVRIGPEVDIRSIDWDSNLETSFELRHEMFEV